MARSRSAVPAMQQFRARDFSGGPNLRDAPSQVADNELVDAWNVSFDRRGGVSSRLGYQKYNPTAFGGAGDDIKNVYYSATLGEIITQAGDSLYVGTNTTAVKTFTTDATVGFADFNGKVYAAHPVDGIFDTTDGATWTVLADPDAPTTVSVLTVWQNKLWASGNGVRVSFSDAGDGEAWTTSSWVDLREKDAEDVVAFGSPGGLDQAGKQGLAVFKRRSAYRIYDSDSGAYQTIDARVGAAGPLAVANVDGHTYTISEYGIFYTNGLSKMKSVSERFRPLWHQSQINLAQLPLFAAGQHNGLLHFSLPRANSTANDLALELDPQTGSIAPGSNAMAAYATFVDNTEKLYGGSPSVDGQVYELYTGGTDDGAAIESRAQLRWFEPAAGSLCQLWRLRFHGHGSPVAKLRLDYAASGGTDHFLSMVDDVGIVYDDALVYGTGLLYVTAETTERTEDVMVSAACKAFSVVLSATTTDVAEQPQLLGAGTGREIGSWSLYGLDVMFVNLAVG